MTEPNQFEKFMLAYQDMVFSTAVRLLGNEAEAEDVSQEVFLKAYERFADLAGSATVGGWLKTVTRNLCLNHLTRYRARWRFFSEMAVDEEDEHPVDIPVESATSAEMDDADRRAMLERVLQKLPATQRVPLVLYHFEEMSYEEIAAKLRISLAKVKTDIHRARETLRRFLKVAVAGDPEWFGAPQPRRPAPEDESRHLSLRGGFAPEIVFNQRFL